MPITFQGLYTIASVCVSIGAIFVVLKYIWRWIKSTVSKSYKLANTWNTVVESVAKLVEFADDVRRLMAEGRDLMQKLAFDIRQLQADHERLRSEHEELKSEVQRHFLTQETAG